LLVYIHIITVVIVCIACHNYVNLIHIKTISISINKEAISSSETSKHLTSAQCKIPKEGHHLFNNRRANLKPYINILT
jgi:hypothetical protein